MTKYFEVNRTVMVVDDDAAVRDMLTLRLSREGCYIQCAASVDSARSIICSDPPDIVLLEMEIAGNDIPEFHRELLEQNPKAKLLLMASPDAAHRSIWLGLNLLTKPIHESALINAIGSCRG
jgi:DNA-binding response OmpR family regulator